MTDTRTLREQLAAAKERAEKAEARPSGPWRHAANQGAGSGGSIYAGRELIAACQGDADYVAVVEAHNAEVADLRRTIAAKDAALCCVTSEDLKDDILCDDGFTMSYHKGSPLHKQLLAALSPDAGKVWMSPEERREDDAVLNDAMSMAHRDREKHKARADAWREDAENLAQFIPVKNNPAGQAALAAHDALVAKEKGPK